MFAEQHYYDWIEDRAVEASGGTAEVSVICDLKQLLHDRDLWKTVTYRNLRVDYRKRYNNSERMWLSVLYSFRNMVRLLYKDVYPCYQGFIVPHHR